ncbi:O-antigen ligase family protein [Sphingomonas qomolangmaensis]|uniref:O-antigen ligase family protein n=1 Tax=Sphingomonas qomolangmaensis TaxID=2918765 RepID=A0ABY5L5E7_9SPHN|nr:O-antigen ligase family protein [Sphingomonas qomolangmaensis]UUL82175.1 O-antigen ligase family protein [Sphingomonas qomolangmaensis]
MVSLLVLRPALVLGIGLMLVLPGASDWKGLRPLLLLLALFAATMLAQLVPLPADWWSALPGHDRYAGIVGLAPGVARPMSLTPDLTINSLLALLPAIAVIVAFAGMREADRWRAAWIVIGVGVASVIFGVFQTMGGAGPADLSGQSDEGVVTGLLANRNHGAVLLALLLPVTAILARARFGSGRLAWAVFAGVALIVSLLMLLTGSRQGIVLGIVVLIASLGLLLDRKKGAPIPWRIVAAVLIVLVLGAVAAIANGRALSVERLTSLTDFANDARFRNLPVMLQICRDFFPFGIGYGAFDPVFRGYEPESFLHSTYFNRAHNDLLETFMAGGVAALVPVALLLLWVAYRALAVFRSEPARRVSLDRAALLIVVVLLGQSLVDYPLRTGIMSMIFAIGCCWLAVPPRAPEARRGARRGGSAKFEHGSSAHGR